MYEANPNCEILDSDIPIRSAKKNDTTDQATKIAEEYVSFIVENGVPKVMSLSEIVDATYRDPLVKEIKSSILYGKWLNFVKAKSPERTALYKLRNEFTVSEKVLFSEIIAFSFRKNCKNEL